MRSRLLLAAIVLMHLVFGAVTYATYALGQRLAPDLMASPVMAYPLVIGVAGIWVWFAFFSVDVLRRTENRDAGD